MRLLEVNILVGQNILSKSLVPRSLHYWSEVHDQILEF